MAVKDVSFLTYCYSSSGTRRVISIFFLVSSGAQPADPFGHSLARVRSLFGSPLRHIKQFLPLHAQAGSGYELARVEC